jgi:hypothetical protein
MWIEAKMNDFIDNANWAMDAFLHIDWGLLQWHPFRDNPPFSLQCFRELQHHQEARDEEYCNHISHHQAQAFQECESIEFKGGLDMLCYYQRVQQICMNEDMITGYEGLFSKGYKNATDLEKQLAGVFGDSVGSIPLQTQSLMEEARRAVTQGPDLSPRKGICDGDAFASSLSIDHVSLDLTRLDLI